MEIASVTCALECSQPNPFHLVLRQPLLRPVVKLGCSRALVSRHLLGVLERAAVGEVSGDPGGAESVAADFPRDAGRAIFRTLNFLRRCNDGPRTARQARRSECVIV
jgi:hypothetical protein